MDDITPGEQNRMDHAATIIEDHRGEDPNEDFNTPSLDWFKTAKYAVCFENESKDRWVTPYYDDRELAAMYAQHGDDELVWFEDIYDLDTGKLTTAKIGRRTIVTINDTKYEF